MAELRAPSTPTEIAGAARDLEGAHPREVVAWALQRFGTEGAVVVTALQAGGVAVADMARSIEPDVRIVTIDTGRLPGATLAYLRTVEARLGTSIEVVRPVPLEVERFTEAHGTDSIFNSPRRRLDCCHVRKVAPLERVLDGVDAWMTGLRREQSETRSAAAVVEVDAVHGGLTKVNPVASWSEREVRDYLAQRGIPLHPLYADGYASIGCAPCTRPVARGEDARAGRWWWENGVSKECGIHARVDLGSGAVAV